MVEINWNNIGAVDGQRIAFEELVCQLAGKEAIGGQTKFVRVGTPDGGKECFWEFQDGTIHAWQAKYFTKSLNSSEWGQLSQSVKDAIGNHPNLTTYYVAVPMDRPDGKVTGRKSMLTKWDEMVESWQIHASSKGMSVSFEFWGSYELTTRLLSPENEGLKYYFFNQKTLSSDWLNRKNEENIFLLGGRYSPELNFDLPIAKAFDGLKRDRKYKENHEFYFNTILGYYSKIDKNSLKKVKEETLELLKESLECLEITFTSISFSGTSEIPLGQLSKNLNDLTSYLESLRDEIIDLREKQESKKRAKGERLSTSLRPFETELKAIEKVDDAIYDYSLFIETAECKLGTNPFLIVGGNAGMGKSHLLADIVNNRTKDGYESLLLLGEHFSTREQPWTQILKNLTRLGIENEEVFLGALNAKAESQQKRIVIFIDAINEGEGRIVWKNQIIPFIRSINRFPWIGLVLSIRSTYEKLFINRDDNQLDTVVRITHNGFGEVEYEASNHFFQHYGITPPTTPLLHPEFQNPLFLKLFCLGLKKQGKREAPLGLSGITSIIELYIEAVEKSLSSPDQLDYDLQLRPVHHSLEAIIDKLIESDSDHLPYEKAETVVRGKFEGICGGKERQFLKRLISEGLLNEDVYWDEKGNHYRGIHFAYQRFQDHQFVAKLLDRHLGIENPENAFSSDSILGKLIADPQTASYQQNLIEALSIQTPERTGKELHELAPQVKDYYSVAQAFVDGILWRKPETLGSSARKYINDIVIHDDQLFHRFLDVQISVAIRPNFLLNAELLHTVLFKNSLSERDAWWTTWLQNKYGRDSYPNSVRRLIDWAWDETDSLQIGDEAAYLAALTLGWFLTSSNRYLRDATTKSMVCLLQNRLPILIRILETFSEVNDPYVFERLYAVAYGCALRTSDHSHLKTLAELVFNSIFNVEEVLPHILLRDYARGVIEYSIHLGLSPNVDIDKIRPPYHSTFPTEYPSNEEIDAKFEPKNDDGHYGHEEWGATAILRSMTTEYGRGGGYGDFGRYVFQSGLSDWEVDHDGPSNYAVQKIFELGYDPKVFTSFDQRQGSGRSSGHMERIGKKYQWIVFYDLLARVADNCKLIDESRWGENVYRDYEGPWLPYVRDIDPTLVIKKTAKVDWLERLEKPAWWCPCSYDNWNADETTWVNDPSDFPSVESLLIVRDNDGVEWINLDILPKWFMPKPKWKERFDGVNRRMYYEIGSWLVKNSELKELLKHPLSIIARKQTNPSNRYQVFSREYHWSASARFFESSYYHGGGTGKELELHDESRICDVFYTSVYFLWEEEFDCSKEETIGYNKPTSILATNLKPSLKEGTFENSAGEVVCFDPSVYEKGPASLLIRKDYLTTLLSNQDMTLVWPVVGEKQVYGMGQVIPGFEHWYYGLFYLNGSGVFEGKHEKKLTQIR